MIINAFETYFEGCETVCDQFTPLRGGNPFKPTTKIVDYPYFKAVRGEKSSFIGGGY